MCKRRAVSLFSIDISAAERPNLAAVNDHSECVLVQCEMDKRLSRLIPKSRLRQEVFLRHKKALNFWASAVEKSKYRQ